MTIRLCLILALLSFVTSQIYAADLTFSGPGDPGGTARAIAIDPRGDILVASDSGLAYYDSHGKFLHFQEGLHGQLNDLRYDSEGHLYVATNMGYIIWYKPEGTITIGGFSGFNPWGAAIDENQNIYGTDQTDIRMSNSQGQLIKTLNGPGADAFSHPFNLIIDSHNQLLASDQVKPGLWIFGPDGKFINRVLPDIGFMRLEWGLDSKMLYATTRNKGLVEIDPATWTVVKQIPDPYPNDRGFAVDKDGNLYFGGWQSGVAYKTDPNGKVLFAFGEAYQATVSVPDHWIIGKPVIMPIHTTSPTGAPLPDALPPFRVSVRPLTLNDSDYANSLGDKPALQQANVANWDNAGTRILPITQSINAITVEQPDNLKIGIYELNVDTAASGPTLNPGRTILLSVGGETKSASLTLYIPRGRDVFKRGETVEINAIICTVAPISAGILQINLAPLQGDQIEPSARWVHWGSVTITAGGNRTLTFYGNTSALFPGRYRIVASLKIGDTSMSSDQALQIVDNHLQATRFHILFPEWSAGYTHIFGPFTGAGMRADSKQLADEGINLYDVEIGNRSDGPPVTAPSNSRQTTIFRMVSNDPSLGAPERYMQESPLEIELNEALRNHLQVQRDIWGGFFLQNWGYATPLGRERDERGVKLWTQWQREWPSWIGHRYLSLSLDEGWNPERSYVRDQAEKRGLVIPSNDDLKWAQNSGQRGFISNSVAGMTSSMGAVGADSKGNIYCASTAGMLLKYTSDGTLLQSTPVSSGVIDLAVRPDGTAYVASYNGRVDIVSPDGTRRGFTPQTSNWSPRGIAYEPGGTLLIADQGGHRLLRYTTDGKLLSALGTNQIQTPNGMTELKDGTIVASDASNGSLVFLTHDGRFIRSIKKMGSPSFGGKMDVQADSDDTLWVTDGYGSVNHFDLTGQKLGTVGHYGFCMEGTAQPMSVAITPDGNILVGSSALPFASEFKPDNTPVRSFGAGTLLLEARTNHTRYAPGDRIVLSLFAPLPDLEPKLNSDAKPTATLQVFAQQATKPGDQEAPWKQLIVTPQLATSDFVVTAPAITGSINLRLVWAPPGASATEHPGVTFGLVIETPTTADAARLADIEHRQYQWVSTWAHAREGGLVRWTRLSDAIRPGTEDLAPTNYGTIDNLGEGRWIPWEQGAVVASAENVGHDAGEFPLMGPFYGARAAEGPNAKPFWSSLLEWHFNADRALQRPMRDTVLLLGAGASGIGAGKFVQHMTPPQLAVHRQIVDLLQRVGEATMNLQAPEEGGVAILHSFSQECMDPYNKEQFWTVQAAYYDLMRLHVPVSVISEEAIAAGELQKRGFKAVFLPDIEHPLPADTMAGLAAFEKSKGEVWTDLNSKMIPGARVVQVGYRPFWAQDSFLSFVEGVGVGGYDGNWEYWRQKSGSNQRLPALARAFGKWIIHTAVSADPNIFIQQRKGGAATWLFISNDHYMDKPLGQTALCWDSPVPATVPIAFQTPALYDATAMREVSATTNQIAFTDLNPARIYVALPTRIGSVRLTTAIIGGTLYVRATVLNTAGNVLPAVIPVEINIVDSAGNELLHRYTCASSAGYARVSMAFGVINPSGPWKITARELLSGKQAIPININPAPTTIPLRLTPLTGNVLVFDSAAITKWLQTNRGHSIWIALGQNQGSLKPDADRLAVALNHKGILAKVINIQDLPEVKAVLDYSPNNPARDEALAQCAAGKAILIRQMPPGAQDPLTPGPRRMIERPLILMGDPTENPWLADIDGSRLTPRFVSPDYPGTGRALLQYCWSPFYNDCDVITISGTDPSGIAAGVNSLTGMAQQSNG